MTTQTLNAFPISRTRRARRLLSFGLASLLLSHASLVRAQVGFEVGSNDQRISDMGLDGVPSPESVSSVAVAYNPDKGQYLVVWIGSEGVCRQVFGQIIDAKSGHEVGANDFLIGNGIGDASSLDVAYGDGEYLVAWNDEDVYVQRLSAEGLELGVDDQVVNGDSLNLATSVSVAYDPSNRQYLLVWDDFRFDPIGAKTGQIIGQLIDADTGAEIGVDDFSIGTGSPFGNQYPAVAHNPSTHEFFVVWKRTEFGIGSIRGQRLDSASASPIGASEFQINSSTFPDQFWPRVVYAPSGNQYLVIWAANFEILARRVDGATGAPQAHSEFVVSKHVSIAFHPDVAFDSNASEYLIVFSAFGDLQALDPEIYARRLAVRADEGNRPSFRISDMGSDGDVSVGPLGPSYGRLVGVAHSAARHEALVVWWSDDEDLVVPGEFEVFGQRLMRGVLASESGRSPTRNNK